MSTPRGETRDDNGRLVGPTARSQVCRRMATMHVVLADQPFRRPIRSAFLHNSPRAQLVHRVARVRLGILILLLLTGAVCRHGNRTVTHLPTRARRYSQLTRTNAIGVQNTHLPPAEAISRGYSCRRAGRRACRAAACSSDHEQSISCAAYTSPLSVD